MHLGRTVFSQLLDFLPKPIFDQCVRRYRGNRRIWTFSCFDQYLCMVFAQITYRQSLRDIETCLWAQQSKLYHCGIRGIVSRNTLAKANEQRDWHIYADFAHALIARARTLYAADDFGVQLDREVYALDSTTIDLCLTLFPWATFRRHKAAVKIHTLMDLRGSIPSIIRITDGKTHDVNILDDLTLEPALCMSWIEATWISLACIGSHNICVPSLRGPNATSIIRVSAPHRSTRTPAFDATRRSGSTATTPRRITRRFCVASVMSIPIPTNGWSF
jgi:hypothetical protein